MINFEKMIALLKAFLHVKFPITWKNGCFPLEGIYNIKKSYHCIYDISYMLT